MMASRPQERCFCRKVIPFTAVIVFLSLALLLEPAVSAGRPRGKETTAVLQDMHGYPLRKFQDSKALSSQITISKSSRRSSKTNRPRSLHEVHSGPNPISNSIPMQALDTIKRSTSRPKYP